MNCAPVSLEIDQLHAALERREIHQRRILKFFFGFFFGKDDNLLSSSYVFETSVTPSPQDKPGLHWLRQREFVIRGGDTVCIGDTAVVLCKSHVEMLLLYSA